jgi:hypothetical protein
MGNPTRSKTSSLYDSRWDMVRHIFWVRNILDLLVHFFTQDWIHNVKLGGAARPLAELLHDAAPPAERASRGVLGPADED